MKKFIRSRANTFSYVFSDAVMCSAIPSEEVLRAAEDGASMKFRPLRLRGLPAAAQLNIAEFVAKARLAISDQLGAFSQFPFTKFDLVFAFCKLFFR